MKKLTSKSRFALVGVAAGAFALTISLARAENPADKDLRGRTEAQVARLFENGRQARKALNLSDAQKTKLRALMGENLPKARAIWLDKTLSSVQKREKLQELRGAAKIEAAQFLTPDQIQKAEKIKDAGKTALFQTLAAFSKELDLSSEQQQKIRAIVWQSFQNGVQAGPPPGDRLEKFRALKSKIEATVGKINTVLTPAQQSKFAVIRSAARTEVMKQFAQLRREGAFG